MGYRAGTSISFPVTVNQGGTGSSDAKTARAHLQCVPSWAGEWSADVAGYPANTLATFNGRLIHLADDHTTTQNEIDAGLPDMTAWAAVSSATELPIGTDGEFVSFGGDGNLTDSGYSESDFVHNGWSGGDGGIAVWTDYGATVGNSGVDPFSLAVVQNAGADGDLVVWNNGQLDDGGALPTVPTGVAWNLAGFDGDGNLSDSGYYGGGFIQNGWTGGDGGIAVWTDYGATVGNSGIDPYALAVVSNTGDDGNVVIWSNGQLGDGGALPVVPTGAAWNLAGFDGNGNLGDSGFYAGGFILNGWTGGDGGIAVWTDGGATVGNSGIDPYALAVVQNTGADGNVVVWSNGQIDDGGPIQNYFPPTNWIGPTQSELLLHRDGQNINWWANSAGEDMNHWCLVVQYHGSDTTNNASIAVAAPSLSAKASASNPYTMTVVLTAKTGQSSNLAIAQAVETAAPSGYYAGGGLWRYGQYQYYQCHTTPSTEITTAPVYATGGQGEVVPQSQLPASYPTDRLAFDGLTTTLQVYDPDNGGWNIVAALASSGSDSSGSLAVMADNGVATDSLIPLSAVVLADDVPTIGSLVFYDGGGYSVANPHIVYDDATTTLMVSDGSGGGVVATDMLKLKPQSSAPAPVVGGIYCDGTHYYGCTNVGAGWVVIL